MTMKARAIILLVILKRGAKLYRVVGAVTGSAQETTTEFIFKYEICRLVNWTPRLTRQQGLTRHRG